MVQAKQALFATMRVSLIELPLRFSACSNWPVSKLRVGQPLGQVDGGGRAQLGHPLPAGGVGQVLPHGPDGFHERRRIGDVDAARAADGHCFKVLGPHDRTDAGPTRRPVLVVDDAGEADQVFARRPDTGHADAGDAQLFADAVLGLRSRLAPERLGVTDLHNVIIKE
jgi:hypothetical protein